ncbi:hypothetical protein HMPREF1326_03298 [Akkermansia sp. KLE1605]|nr:hypothetical protein HMPREF1326_03298 [Akkermansia sp. KLE1605]
MFLNVDVFQLGLDADGSVFLKVVAFLRGDDARERERREVEFVPGGGVFRSEREGGDAGED